MGYRRPVKLVFIGLFSLSLFVLAGCGTETTLPEWAGKVPGTFPGCATGVYPSGEAGSSVLGTFISSFETLVSKEAAVVMWYVGYGEPFPSDRCNAVRSKGAIPMITWEFRLSPIGMGTLEMIGTGSLDAVVGNFAVAARNWGHCMFLRPMHEMNGDWYPWSGTWNGGNGVGTAEYIAAWRRVYDIFGSAGARNVTFVWSPNARSVVGEPWNDMTNYYPGDQYVDWVAVDGYNFCGTQAEGSYEAFADIFSAAISTLESYSKPVMIGEFSCAEGPDKGGWITDAFDKIRTQYQLIKAFIWFNRDKRAEGEHDWRVDSDADSLSAYRSAAGDSYFREDIF